jgi:hypothetical protein
MAKSLEEKKNNIVGLMNKSEIIHDTSHVNVQVMTKGFLFWKKDSLLLNGRVNKEAEKQEILAIVAKECPGVIVEEKLRVENR